MGKAKSLFVLGGFALGGLALGTMLKGKGKGKGKEESDDESDRLAEDLVVPLVDAEERARLFPGSFQLPPRSLRDSLAPGDIAKVIVVTPQHSGERLWIKVQEELGEEGVYLGTLDNDATLLPLRSGHLLAFGPEHIVEVMRGTLL